MKFLIVGDIVGRPGRRAAREILPGLRKQYGIDQIIVNGENAAGGTGLTQATADELFQYGVDVITSGNHIWDQKDIIPYLDAELPIIRPLNYPPRVPGRGYVINKGVLVVSLLGRTFMTAVDCPFRTMDRLLDTLTDRPKTIIIDFHAEATSEKVAMGRYLDGRVSVVVGTHTHVPTADHRMLPRGTAYVTDLGMTGPVDSIIGNDVDEVLMKFLTQIPRRLPVGKGNVALNSVLVDVDESGKAKSIQRLDVEIV